MLEVIYGRRGSGKTKQMVDVANALVKDCSGDIVYIDDDNRCSLVLNHEIRLMNAAEYDIKTPTGLRGFVCGVMASDYDIEHVLIDGFPKIVGLKSVNDLVETVEKLEVIANKNNIKITISVSGEPGSEPDFIKNYMK